MTSDLMFSSATGFSVFSGIYDGHLAVTQTISSYNTTNLQLTQQESVTKPLANELKTTRLIVQRILTPVVVACGIVGNLINLAVLTRRWMKSSTNRYLTALAFCDVMYLILVFTISLSHYESLDARSSDVYQRYMYTVGRPLTDTFSNAGVWLTLTFTIERYIGVCHPMRGKVWCTPRRAKCIIIVVFLAATIITFPEFFEFKMVKTLDPVTNQTRLSRSYTWLARTTSYSVGYKYANQTLFTFLPLILLLVFNSLLIRQVMVAAAERHKMMGKPRYSDSSSVSGGLLTGGNGNLQQDRQARDQQRITIMLISVVVVFLLCQLPQAVQHIYLVYFIIIGVKHSPYEDQMLKITGNVFNLLVMVNCSANFILYSAFSTKFRATFSRLFCRYLCCAKKLYRAESGQDTGETSTAGRYTVLQSSGPAHRHSRPSCGLSVPLAPRGVRSASDVPQVQHLGEERHSKASITGDQTPSSCFVGGLSTAVTPNGLLTNGDNGNDNDGDWYAPGLMLNNASKSDRQIVPDRLVTHL